MILVVSLVLTACGGGTTGATWFNLPSLPVTLATDGGVSIFGQTVTYIDPGLVQQLQSASLQKLEIRPGYHGILLYANGEALPYISWDATSVATLQELIQKAPNIPNAALIASALPVLRQIGLGVAVNVGTPAPATMAWHGETVAIAEEIAPTVGPFQLGGIAFDEQGGLAIGGLSAAALGVGGPLLPPETLNLLSSFGIENIQVATTPNGIQLSTNGKPLPSIAYDSQSLPRVEPLVAAFAPALAPTLSSVLPVLQSTAVDVAVSFTGEPVGELSLAEVPVAISEDGSLSVFGMAVAPNALPADLLQKLQQAGVQQLNVEISQEGVFLAADGQTLPTITWTPESMQTLAGIVAPLAGVSPEMISSGLALIQETGAIKAAVALPGAEPATGGEINKTLTTPDVADQPIPVLHLNAAYSDGSIESLGGLADLPMLPLVLPPNVAQILGGLNASELQLDSDPGKLNLLLDGATALTLNYDDASLKSVLTLAGPFLGGTPLENPAILALLQDQILPLVPAADLDIKVALQ
ncbi:MAG: hypothetical protein KF832_17935 [Caldilineaceae bacterium]|nr:hypothetical protein [Caldilineaceae bacterium]